MKKGDFLFSSDHVIEIVAKLFLQVEGADKVDGADTKKPQIQFGTKYVSLLICRIGVLDAWMYINYKQ